MNKLNVNPKFSHEKIDSFIFSSAFCGMVVGQTVVITGSWFQSVDKLPVRGVTVWKKTQNGIIIDMEGIYKLETEHSDTIVSSRDRNENA
ncbi:MAG: hypothetical protein IPH57_00145 [Saprospiraceae bacterium]|nr:hypothetical protein [Saprospiraceae bacterium]